MKANNKEPLNKDQSPESQPPASPAGPGVPAENNAPASPGDDAQAKPGSQPQAEAQQPDAGSQAPMVALTMEEFDTLQCDLQQARAKAAEYFDGWQRERADFSNFKKRIDRDNAQVYQNALVAILKKYLVILDDLDRALKNPPTHGEGGHWVKGIELIEHKLLNAIEAEGVKRMDAGDGVFDPNRHEAISYEDNPDHQSGQIIEVVQPGYLIGDRVLRPALVRVAR
jgi:molecular chaperone GrpE